MKPDAVPFAQQCEREYRSGDAMLVCYLRAGHDGPHWDDEDDVTWWVDHHAGPPRADNSYSVKLDQDPE